jgi:hypothetical protein
MAAVREIANQNRDVLDALLDVEFYQHYSAGLLYVLHHLLFTLLLN